MPLYVQWSFAIGAAAKKDVFFFILLKIITLV